MSRHVCVFFFFKKKTDWLPKLPPDGLDTYLIGERDVTWMLLASGNLRILVLKWAYSTPYRNLCKEKEDNSY